MINADESDLTFNIQTFQPQSWRLVCDTSRPSPNDICSPGQEPPVTRSQYEVKARSIVILLRPRANARQQKTPGRGPVS
jgi:hypothetical protein